MCALFQWNGTKMALFKGKRLVKNVPRFQEHPNWTFRLSKYVIRIVTAQKNEISIKDFFNESDHCGFGHFH